MLLEDSLAMDAAALMAADLPEIKAEIKAEDFAAQQQLEQQQQQQQQHAQLGAAAVVVTQHQQLQQQQQQQQQQNCQQWVSFPRLYRRITEFKTVFFLFLYEAVSLNLMGAEFFLTNLKTEYLLSNFFF